jgi:hypothetical protein
MRLNIYRKYAFRSAGDISVQGLYPIKDRKFFLKTSNLNKKRKILYTLMAGGV